ncbi:Kinase [Mycena chlorophos]|uniref:Kinase n=1 Tax=Mycena chlorophos TaxID=658473 RepID=A0A8H6VSG9_MYCCL|nr:Kinase [Mycena chlorophos]
MTTENIARSPQIGGHTDGVLATEDDMLLIKQALPVELQFYRAIAAASDPQITALRPWIPRFLGTLTLQGEIDPDAPTSETNIPVKPLSESSSSRNDNKDEFGFSLVLENLTHPFSKPNILDIKLGTVLYDENAPPDKVARMIKTAETTTTLRTGMRLTAFQVYDNASGDPVLTPKTYGKSISAEQLPEGFERFFPVAGTQGLPAPLLLQILELLREDVQDIRDVLADIELRMIGASLLILYESDAARAEEGIKWMLRDPDEDEQESEDEDEDDEEEDGPPRPYDVRLIDFAHTRFTAGKGPDDGVLLGLDTILDQLDRRMAAVRSI